MLEGDAQLLWKACAELVREQVSDGVWASSFAVVDAVELDDDQLTLSVPAAWVKLRIEERYLDVVRAALADAGAPGLDLAIEVRPSNNGDTLAVDPLELRFDADADDDVEGGPLQQVLDMGPRTPTPGVTRAPDAVNPKYTFDAFVTGASNRFAHAAALAVAERPGLSYNPLFIYGDAGLGKTHLLQAIAHYVRENYPAYVVRYVSSEAFLNEFVEKIKTGDSESFKRRYRDVDVLLVDDIQFFEGKKETLEEFFHTFNTLYETNRQIVLSCDRSPDDLPTLEDRLRSRFKSGLLTDIQPPDLETRLAILRKKAEREAAAVAPEVLELIATHVTDNIRELEGALIRVSAFASLTKEQLSVDQAKRVLGDILTERRPRPITPRRILEATSAMFDFPIDDLIGKSRRRPLVTARQIAMYVMRELTDLSYPAIAREFGGRDHTTVIHAVEKISAQMGEKQTIYDQVLELIQSIKSGD
jgi:chromosomal replication initiator protein